MITLLLSFHVLILIYTLKWVSAKKSRVYEYPFLATLVWFAFLVPQFIGLSNSDLVSENALVKTLVFSLLCLLAIHLGYFKGSKKSKGIIRFPLFNNKRLWISAVVLFIMGVGAFFLVNRLPEEAKGSQWSGTVVAFNFFANNLKYAMAIAFLLIFGKVKLNQFYKITLLGIIILGLSLYLDRIIIAGRKGTALEILFIVLMSLYFTRNYIVKRSYMLVLFALGTLGLFSTGQYRYLMNEHGNLIEVLQQIDYTNNFENISDEGGEEVKNAVLMIDAVDQTLVFDFGIFHWNTLVFNYVPAQLLGAGFKSSIQMDIIDPVEIVNPNYSRSSGSTNTGLSDAYYSFWYFGCIKFFIIGYLMAIVFRNAQNKNLIFQLFYMLILSSSLHAITHHTQWFFSPWVHMFIFLYPLLLYSKKKKNAAILIT